MRFLPASTLHPPTSLRRPPGARRQRGRGVLIYGRAVGRRVCGHVARRLAYQRGQVCQERLAIEFPAVPAALQAPECHVPRAPFRREATITARAAHRTGAVIFAPDAPPPSPPLQRRFQVGPVRHGSPAPPPLRGPLRRFLRASRIRGNPRETASRITAETDVCVASASASSAAAVARSYLSSVNVYRCLTGIRRVTIMIDNYRLCFKPHRPPRPRSPNAPTRRGRWPSPRRPPGSSPTPLSASTPDGPTPARCGAWTPGAGPPPVDDASLAVYLGEPFEAGRAPATAALAVAAVRFRAKLAGQPAPAGEATARVLGGYRRTAADRGRGQAAPLRADSPRRHGDSPTTSHLPPTRRRDSPDCFMGGLRRSEVAAVRWADVTDATDGDGVLVTVRTSKTNHEGDAADVRYLKNGAAKAIRTLRAVPAPTPPPQIGWSGCRRCRFSAASPRPPAPPASRRA